MSHNSFGRLFRVTTFGEVTGRESGASSTAVRRAFRWRRRTFRPNSTGEAWTSRFTTQRREPDEARILSGVMIDEASGRQVTTGTPIGVIIDNVDQR